MATGPILEVSGACKSFGGVRALSDVSFRIDRGEIVGLIGPNGAGKTALINVITGFYRPDLGAVRIDGRETTRRSLHAIGRAGVARTFQNLRLFRRMSVLENVLVGQGHNFRHPWRSIFRIGRRRDIEAARDLLARFGLVDRADQSAGSLSYGDGRRLEIARALATRPKLLLLDEPAAGMNEEETAVLAGDIRDLPGDLAGILLVEHDIAFVRTLSDRIVALESGQVIADGPAAAVLAHPRVIEAYLGGTVESDAESRCLRCAISRSATARCARCGAYRSPLPRARPWPSSGANGAGKTTLLRALSNMIPLGAGEVHFGEASTAGRKPHALLRDGLLHVPEGRGTLQKLTVLENLQLAWEMRRSPERFAAALDRVVARFSAAGRAAGLRRGKPVRRRTADAGLGPCRHQPARNCC